MAVALSTDKIQMGCDPEFFFERDGKIIGSEKVIDSKHDLVEKDGVQGELHPRPSECRQVLASNIRNCFFAVAEFAAKHKVNVSMNSVISVPKEEFDSLSESSKIFGCKPDYNIYTGLTNEINVDPKISMIRSAGGHLHLGVHRGYFTICNELGQDIQTISFAYPSVMDVFDIRELYKNKTYICKDNDEIHNIIQKVYGYDPFKSRKNLTMKLSKWYSSDEAILQHIPLIKLLDIIVGNTCVLLDRNPDQQIRRQTYGRAGDYRLPKYGIEYRTLSNFWLQHYTLMSLVFGLAREAVLLLATDIINNNYNISNTIIESIDEADIKNAINNNDFELAKQNFLKFRKAIKSLKISVYSPTYAELPLIKSKDFSYFMKLISLGGVETFFKSKDVINHWKQYNSSLYDGWDRFKVKQLKACTKKEFLACK